MRTSYNRDAEAVLTFEWLTLAAALAACAAGLASPARLVVCAAAAALATTVVVAADALPIGIRLILPHLYLGALYWLPALMVAARRGLTLPTAFETWLVAADARFSRHLPTVPARLRALFEAAYLGCYPLLPITCALTWIAGSPDDLDRFWTSVLGACVACYGSLPWLLSRPPRVLEGTAAIGSIRSLNLGILGRVSHRWNTFPSGHVAVATAAALSLWMVWPLAGVAALVVAAAVGIGAASGRYHFAVDVALGFLVGVGAVVLTW